MGCVGMWGDYCEREGHGKYGEWTRKETEKYILNVSTDADSLHHDDEDKEVIEIAQEGEEQGPEGGLREE
eukprot:6690806-Prymnesium_polylepis.1